MVGRAALSLSGNGSSNINSVKGVVASVSRPSVLLSAVGAREESCSQAQAIRLCRAKCANCKPAKQEDAGERCRTLLYSLNVGDYSPDTWERQKFDRTTGATAPRSYRAAISRVARIGSFSTRQSAERFESLGLTRSFSQK